MPEPTLELTESPSAADLTALTDGLTAHSLEATGAPAHKPLAVFARDADGRVVGGAQGRLNWNWVDVSLLWVDEPLRGRGLGARLLAALEDAARARGCRASHLETFTFQARAFYEKQGYEVFAVLEDYGPGCERIYLRKALQDAAS